MFAYPVFAIRFHLYTFLVAVDLKQSTKSLQFIEVFNSFAIFLC